MVRILVFAVFLQAGDPAADGMRMRCRCLRGRRRAFGAVSFGIVVAFFEPAREDGGRRIVGAGKSEEIAGLAGSHTGRFLRGMFGS